MSTMNQMKDWVCLNAKVYDSIFMNLLMDCQAIVLKYISPVPLCDSRFYSIFYLHLFSHYLFFHLFTFTSICSVFSLSFLVILINY